MRLSTLQKPTAPSSDQVKQAMRDYDSEAQRLGCPSAPQNAILVIEEPDRPQPRLDSREDESGIFDLKFVALSYNSKGFFPGYISHSAIC